MSKRRELRRKRPGVFFRIYRGVIKLFKKEVKFYHVGSKEPEGTLILSNHEASKGPLAWELDYDKTIRMMGTEEMNSGFKRLYAYQTRVYYHQKHKWNLTLARLFCLIASPIVYCFYEGLQLISIRKGVGLKTTIQETHKALFEYNERVVIFPEDSSRGYFKEIEEFKQGFLLICEQAYKRGHDMTLAVAYVKPQQYTCLIDEPIRYSSLLEKYSTRDEIAEALRQRCNELGRLNHTDFRCYENR